MSGHGISAVPFVTPSTSYPNATESQSTQSASRQNPLFLPEIVEMLLVNLPPLKIVQTKLVNKYFLENAKCALAKKYPTPKSLTNLAEIEEFLKRAIVGSESLYLNAFYKNVLANEMGNGWNILKLEELFKSAEPPSLESIYEIGLLSDDDLQTLKSASPEYINYLTSKQALFSLIDLNSQGLKFDSSAFLQITPEKLADGMVNEIYQINSIVTNTYQTNQIRQCLSSLRSNSKENTEVNTYSALETLDKKIEVLNTRLTYVSDKNRIAIRNILLMAQCGIFANKHNSDGVTPLYDQLIGEEARANELSGYINILLAAGANPNQRNLNGYAPLHNASIAIFPSNVRLGNTPPKSLALEILLNHGADVNLPDYAGQTPLMKFCQIRSFETDEKRHSNTKTHAATLIKSLIKAGANVNATDKKGWTFKDYADQADNLEAIKASIATLEE